MARFAKIGLNNKVITIVNINDDLLLDADGNKHENLGIEFLTNPYGWSIWKETFKDHSQRKNYAQIGGTYDEDRDAFINKKPYPSWLLNETTCQWEAPVEKPNDDNWYIWNEETTSWDLDE